MHPNEYVPEIEDTELTRNPATGYWEIRWTIPSRVTGGAARTRTRSCRTKDFDLARVVRREYLATLSTVSTKAGAGHTISDLIDFYLRDHADVHGVSATQRDALRVVRRAFGPLDPGNITPGTISGYRSARAGGKAPWTRPVALGTIRRELGSLRAVLNWAAREGHLPKGFAQPHIALPPEGQGRAVTLDAAEEKKLHEHCAALARSGGSRVALFVLIALNTAARAESIETLTWDRVDLRKRLIDFRDKGRRVTKKRRVAVPISDRLFRPLARAWIAQGRPKVGPVLGSFGSTRKGFATITRAVLPGVKITRHDLRRTWATLAAQNGVSMFDIAGVLGDTLPTVEKHYAHHSPGHLRSAVNARA